MPATLRRHPIISTLLAAVALLCAPTAASAASPLAGATLTSVVGTLDIHTARCPGPSDPAAKTCGKLDTQTTFTSATKAPSKTIAGVPKFATGLRIAGSGQSRCTSESPSAGLVQGDTGAIDLESALHVVNAGIASTDLFVATSRRGVRWAWGEPLTPTAPCNYFFGSGTGANPALATSPWIGASLLRHKRFNVTLEGTDNPFEKVDPDGTYVYGQSTWKLVLQYRRYTR
ncbi:MAG: hypothetical protein QOH13_36 [Thermoleophilaceae bacterium]|nr:hypothetical protein [Thermoleophilaceae bacterium]